MGRGGSAYKMMVQQSRAAARYRKDRAQRRRDLRVGERGEQTGVEETCAECAGSFDLNGLIRDDDRWICDICVFEAEADSTLVASRSHTLLGVAAAVFLALPWVMPWFIPPYVEGLWLGLIVANPVAGLLAGNWARGLRKATLGTPWLLVLEVVGFALASIPVLLLAIFYLRVVVEGLLSI